jgi:hypothetical protein
LPGGGAADHVFGVPFFVFRGEAFWGHDRLPLLEQRLIGAGLALPMGSPRDLALARYEVIAMNAKMPMLTGYRVLDLTQFVAGPTCTRLMAELGAEVIKVELAPGGDRGRAVGDKPRDPKFKGSSQSTFFFQHNHSKKSLAIDIKQARGRELVRALVPKVDVLAEALRRGHGARGPGYEELKHHPRPVMCSISLAGQTDRSARSRASTTPRPPTPPSPQVGEPDRRPDHDRDRR